MPASTSRRSFLKSGAAAAATLTARTARDGQQAPATGLARLMSAPVLRRELFPDPVRLSSIELVKAGEDFIVSARSADGATGIAVGHPEVLETTWPILTRKVAPFFVKKDARDLESLLDELYIASSNYKWQGLPFWVPVASVEIAILDLLGRVAAKPFGELFGPIVRRDVAVYRASGNRGNSPEAEIAYLQQLVAETGARAIKYRLGARMRYDDQSTRRDLALIPLTRKTFGRGMAIHADANSSYDVPMALRIGRLMHEQRFAFFEEPVPFDYYDETKEVADALAIPVAGGEQESSMRRFRWLIEHRAVDIVQPDIFYFGGFIRSIRVARMAAARGMDCTPHMSGGGLGYLYVAHFASCVANAGPFQEFKGREDSLPVASETSSLQCVNGMLKVPTGPGLGIALDPAFVARGTRLV